MSSTLFLLASTSERSTTGLITGSDSLSTEMSERVLIASDTVESVDPAISEADSLAYLEYSSIPLARPRAMYRPYSVVTFDGDEIAAVLTMNRFI